MIEGHEDYLHLMRYMMGKMRNGKKVVKQLLLFCTLFCSTQDSRSI